MEKNIFLFFVVEYSFKGGNDSRLEICKPSQKVEWWVESSSAMSVLAQKSAFAGGEQYLGQE